MATGAHPGGPRRLDARGWALIGGACAAVIGLAALRPDASSPSPIPSAAPATSTSVAAPAPTSTVAAPSSTIAATTTTTADPAAAALRTRLDSGRTPLPDTLGAASRLDLTNDDGDVVVLYVLATTDPGAYARAAVATAWSDAAVLFADPSVRSVGIGIQEPGGDDGIETGPVAAGVQIARSAYEAQDWAALGAQLADDPRAMFCLGDQRFVADELPDAVALTSC